MRKLIILAAVAFVGASAVGAHAQCNFDGSPKAKGIKTSLVRAYAGCPSITFSGPNSFTGGNTPGCSPPYAHSNYVFDQKSGSCLFKTKAKKEDPCSFNSVTRPCFNLSLQAKCKGILRDDGVTKINGLADAGWALSTVSRATLDDEDNGDMTIINFPVNIAMSIPANGSISVSGDTNHILSDLGIASLPACGQIEIVSLSLQDPNGNPFAVLGAGTRP